MMNIIPTSQHAEREYLHTLQAGVWVPFAQSTIIAGVFGIGVLAIAYFVFDARDPHKPAIFFAVIAWMYMIWKSYRHWLTLTTVEQIIQYDINGDSEIGEPESKPRRVVIQVDKVKEDGRYQVGDVTEQLKFSCSPEQLQALAYGIANGMPIAEKKWTPLKEGKPFSASTWRTVMQEMLDQKVIEYANPENPLDGFEPTDYGREVMQQYASPLPRPSP